MMQRQTEFQSEHIPYGYLITFRAYGTWLHGRPGSVDRFHNVYEITFGARSRQTLREGCENLGSGEANEVRGFAREVSGIFGLNRT